MLNLKIIFVKLINDEVSISLTYALNLTRKLLLKNLFKKKLRKNVEIKMTKYKKYKVISNNVLNIGKNCFLFKDFLSRYIDTFCD